MYPGLPDAFQEVIKSHSSVHVKDGPVFEYSCFDSVYYYCVTRRGEEISVAAPARRAVAELTAARERGEEYEMDEELEAELSAEGRAAGLDKVTAFSVVLMATEFFPEKYEALGAVLSNVYAATAVTGNVLQAYFKALLKGKVDAGALGAYVADDIDIRQSWLAGSIKDVIVTLGADVVLVWGAMLLGKRVVVYSDTREALAPVLRALPLFVWHKKDWSLLIPFTKTSEAELAHLAGRPAYAAGITSPALLATDDYADLVVNLSNRSVTVSPSASADLAIAPFVKDLAQYLVAAGNDPDMSDGDIIKGLAVKTGELLKKVKSLADPVVTSDALAAANITGPLARFLLNIAVAEGLA